MQPRKTIDRASVSAIAPRPAAPPLEEFLITATPLAQRVAVSHMRVQKTWGKQLIEKKRIPPARRPGCVDETFVARATPDALVLPATASNIGSGETLGDDDLDNLCDAAMADITGG